MKCHILNCVTVRFYFPPLAVTTCCLLVELGDGLLLVDTGLGTNDFTNPSRGVRLARALARTFGRPEETALNQIKRLGYVPADVRQIVMTHLHIDHAGGLPDFPDAKVHVFQGELENANAIGFLHNLVYIPAHWAHGPDWVVHSSKGQVDWFGFEAVPVLEESGIQVLFIPLPGHTRGHCGVAVGDGERWVLHIGDVVTLNALETNPNSVLARPLGPHFPKLYDLAHNYGDEVKIVQTHLFLDKFVEDDVNSPNSD